MRILYAAMKHDYGRPERGLGFEHYNFYDSLVRMGHDILYFDFMGLLNEKGPEGMNRRLLDAARSEKPDLVFTVLFSDELDKAVVRRISEGACTLNWFCDDHWRFDSFSRHWAPCFRWVVTTAQSALPKYEKLGCRNVIKSQWGCNHFLYRRLGAPPRYDVTFVGQPHGDRRPVIETLERARIDVRAWGMGWEAGRLSQDEMIRVFNESRINLNLPNASAQAPGPQRGGWARRRLSRALEATGWGRRAKAVARRVIMAARGRKAGAPAQPSYHQQIKGRNFEVPGCGGFLLTGRADNLEDYYRPGEEVAMFEDAADLVDKVRYYLDHEEERAAVAERGYRRTLREHTYAHRFTDIFRRMGLTCEPLEAVLAGKVRPGLTEEVR